MRMKHAAVVAGLALGLMSGAANAAYTVDIDQVNGNVVATGSGSIDTSGSSYDGSSGGGGFLTPNGPALAVGAGADDFYSSTILGPGPFGSGGSTNNSMVAGPYVGIDVPDGYILVPANYVSGTSLGTSTATFDNQTFATLGVTPGTYTYRFFTGNESTDTFTINVGVSPVPLPASAPMFGAALLALGAIGYGVKRKKAAAAA